LGSSFTASAGDDLGHSVEGTDPSALIQKPIEVQVGSKSKTIDIALTSK